VSSAARLEVTWSPRHPPLEPVAVVADGEPGYILRSATAQRLSAGAQLKVAADEDWIVVLGAALDLPWADGATYLGRDSGVLVPTTLAPSPPASLLREVLPSAPLTIVVPGHVALADMPLRLADPRLFLAAGG